MNFSYKMNSPNGHLSIMDLGFMLNHEQPVSEAITDSYINTHAHEYLRICMLVEDKARKARDSPLLAADLTTSTPLATASSIVPATLENFWYFRKLPPELRVMIWVSVVFPI
jgi:hypothetical protein